MQAMAERISLEQDGSNGAELGTDLNAQDWLELHPSRGSARMRLYCMPSALGRHPAEGFLETRVAEHAEICLVRTPEWSGKAPSLIAQAHALARVLLEDAQSGPFALFGHCSGAILMYEAARKLAEWGGPQPVHLFASSAGAPHLYVMPNAHLLGDEKLLDVLDVIGHPLTEQLRQAPELRRELIPRYRADFEMMSTHQHRDGERLECPITTIRARNDLWTFFYGAEHWSEHTTGAFEIVTDEEGDHFHIEREPGLAVDVITQALGWGRGSHLRVRAAVPLPEFEHIISQGKR
jgi:medium-chain acyl-[acyl-carrier-protein] hydrolase